MMHRRAIKFLIGAFSAVAVALSLTALSRRASAAQPQVATCCVGCHGAAAQACCPAPPATATAACQCGKQAPIPKSPESDQSQRRRVAGSIDAVQVLTACNHLPQASHPSFNIRSLASIDRQAMLCVWRT
jgi:hypothetical protein